MVLRRFSSPRSPHYIHVLRTILQICGLSYSEICASMVICTYTQLIAAYHVLHRLQEPRHPPDALAFFRLTSLVSISTNLRAHTFSCKLLRFNLQVWLSWKSLYLQSCVSICQRSLCRERPPCVGLRIDCVYPVRTTWWRITDSNRWPPACKAGALASWANPPRGESFTEVVPGRLELPTFTLSVWRSNQLSYRTLIWSEGVPLPGLIYSHMR